MFMYVCTNVATYVPALALSENMCECPAAAQSEDIHMKAQPIQHYIVGYIYAYNNDTASILLHTI